MFLSILFSSFCTFSEILHPHSGFWQLMDCHFLSKWSLNSLSLSHFPSPTDLPSNTHQLKFVIISFYLFKPFASLHQMSYIQAVSFDSFHLIQPSQYHFRYINLITLPLFIACNTSSMFLRLSLHFLNSI